MNIPANLQRGVSWRRSRSETDVLTLLLSGETLTQVTWKKPREIKSIFQRKDHSFIVIRPICHRYEYVNGLLWMPHCLLIRAKEEK